MRGTIVGSYRILDTLSAGGMGTVYRAEHTLIGRLAAVKILHPELCTNHDIVNRFFNEAKTTSSIKHPGIVEVFDFGYMPSGHAYLIMEFLEGMPLSHRLRARGPMPEAEAASLLRGVCIALSAAHDKGVVHRDLKPDNIFVVPDPDAVLGERIKILDFGIAKLTDIGLAGSATKTGAVMGTPTYMSPEQCRGTGDVDARADLYSIGCIFYELVTGRPPFIHTGAGELIGAHLFVEPEPPSRHITGVSPESEALIMTLLAKQPERRVQGAKELAQALTGIAQRHGVALSQPSLNHVIVPPPMASGAYPSHGTPVFPPPPLPAPTPAAMAVTLAPAGTPVPGALSAPNPTTLSGAASQIGAAPPRANKRVRLAIAGGLLVVGVSIGAIAAISGRGHDAEPTSTAGQPSPAAAPAAQEPPPPAPTAVAPAPPAAEPATPPAPAAGPAAPAAAQLPDAAPATATKPEPATATPDQPPSTTKPEPATATPTKPGAPTKKPTKKPGKKPDKPKDLIELDI